MLKSIVKSGVISLFAILIASTTAQLNAQSSDLPAVEKKETKPVRATPFHGKLKAVDKTAKTISVGELTIQTTSETRILKDGKPATLEAGIVNETVAGAYRKTEDGRLNATTIRFGAKPEEKNEAPMK
jgi:hypothetical protein